MNISGNERILLLKAERFCTYRERCSHEVKQKMKELGADQKTTEKITSLLKEDGFLNDERFARMYSTGKFRIKGWGKNKIQAGLRMKNISDDKIQNALAQIDIEEYKKTIQNFISKKEKELKSQKPEVRKQKIFRFLLSKGFESSFVLQVLSRDPNLSPNS